MDLDSLDDDDAAQLAERIGPHLDPGSYGDRVVLTKRKFVAAATGTLGAGALATWGVDDATAQAAGSVGTSSSPVDVFGYDVDVANEVAMNGNDIENAGSVNTGSIANAGDPITQNDRFERPGADSTAVHRVAVNAAGDEVVASGTVETDGVGTSDTRIFDLRDVVGQRSALVHVSGSEQGDVTNYFSDLIQLVRAGGIDVINSGPVRGSPTGRTYDQDGSGGQLTLSMASGTYNVVAHGFAVEAFS